MSKRIVNNSRIAKLAQKKKVNQERAARAYRKAHVSLKKAIASLEKSRKEFMKVCGAGENVLGVYHILRHIKTPEEAMLRVLGYWDWIKKETVDTGKFNSIIDSLKKIGKDYRDLYKVSTIHEVGIRK